MSLYKTSFHMTHFLKLGHIWFLSISIGHNVTSTHDKASLITHLYTQGGLLLHVIHKLSRNQSIRW